MNKFSENAKEPNSNPSSPDIIEGTPHSKSLPTTRLSVRLNSALLPNGHPNSPTTSRKKLFADSSHANDDLMKAESKPKVENGEAKLSSKRSSDDAFNELLKEVENSSPSESIFSRSTYFEDSNRRKRLKLNTTRLEKRIVQKSPSKSITNEIGKRHCQTILKRKIKPSEVAGISKAQTKSVITDSTESNLKHDESKTIDIENLGDLFYDEFNSCSFE